MGMQPVPGETEEEARERRIAWFSEGMDRAKQRRVAGQNFTDQVYKGHCGRCGERVKLEHVRESLLSSEMRVGRCTQCKYPHVLASHK